MADDLIDLLIVGGGITGTAIARDAAGRGLAVMLVERDDLAANGSARSTKLIQGGLHDLERGALGQVRGALEERNVLFRNAPHVVRPTRFVLPLDPARSSIKNRALVWLYDQLGRTPGLPPPHHRLDLRRDPARDLFKAHYRQGVAFTDGVCDDTRLIVLNAVDAAGYGAQVLTRTRLTTARRANGLWYALLQQGNGRPTRAVRARALINASGPFGAGVLADVIGTPTKEPPRLLKGGHLIVPALFPEPTVYVLPRQDGGPVYVVPYEGFSLIGPVVIADETDPAADDIGEREIGVLLDTVGDYFVRPPAPRDVEFTFAGVWAPAASGRRGLHEPEIEVEAGAETAPLISVRGGSLTTHRRLAEAVLTRLQPRLGFAAGPWAAHAHLPGGDLGGVAFEAFLAEFQSGHGWLPPALAGRLARTYGTRIHRVIGDATGLRGLGEDLGGGVFEAELDYLRRVELATTAEDVLWRRTKLGLTVSDATARRLHNWLAVARHETAA